MNYIFKWDSKLFHNVHNDTCCWSRSSHGAVHQDNIPVVGLLVELIHGLVNLICYLVSLVAFSLRWHKSCCPEVDFHLIKPSSRVLLHFLMLLELHICLENVIYQGVPLESCFLAETFILESVFNEVVSIWESHSDLDSIMILNVHS